MASARAAAVAEVLWELKRANRVATLTAIARRAGFSAGSNGRTIRSCMETVRRDWPHLDWWRAIDDDGTILKVGVQRNSLQAIGVRFSEDGSKDRVATLIDESLMMVWADDEVAEAGPSTLRAGAADLE